MSRAGWGSCGLGLLLALACANPAPAPGPPPIPPERPQPAAVDEVHWPDLPPLPPRTVLQPVDERVRRLFRDAERFSPEEFMVAMDGTLAIGPDALPSLLRLAEGAEDANTVSALCEAVQRLDVRDDRVAPWLARQIVHPAPWASHPCARAVAHSAPEGSPSAAFAAHLFRDRSAPADLREHLAMSLREPALCPEWAAWIDGPDPLEQRLGVIVLGACDGAGPVLLEVAGDPSQKALEEVALFALRSQPPQPGGREVYLARIATGVRDNGLTSALILLGDVALDEDRAVLQRMIDEDPYDGQGVHADAARQALRKMRVRQ